MLNLCDIQHNPEIEMLMVKVHEYLGTMGAITHDEEHALYVARLSVHILGALGYPEREQQLAEIAGYLHDIGNVVNRYQHGLSGALLAFDFLKRLGMPAEEIATVIAAIGNHEENSGYAVSNVAAAVILADKSNVHRSRVRKEDIATFSIRDRVNYAATTSYLQIDPDQREILDEPGDRLGDRVGVRLLRDLPFQDAALPAGGQLPAVPLWPRHQRQPLSVGSGASQADRGSPDQGKMTDSPAPGGPFNHL